MMELPSRQFITDEKSRRAFLHGAEFVLTKKRMKKVELLRISVKREMNADVLHSVWGRLERAPMGLFKRILTVPLPAKIELFSEEDWRLTGRLIAESMTNWVDNDAEFDRSEGKARGVQFDVWETSANWDRVQDLLDVLEKHYTLHIGGKLHWRVRSALADLIEMLFVDVNTEIADYLSSPQGLEDLGIIMKRAGLESMPAAAKKKLVAVEAS